jgi:hypothetical protein
MQLQLTGMTDSATDMSLKRQETKMPMEVPEQSTRTRMRAYHLARIRTRGRGEADIMLSICCPFQPASIRV